MQNNAAGRKPPEYPLASVDRALRLLALFGERSRVRVADAASALGTARSTAHRLLAMLEYHDFARQDQESKAYEAGPRLVEIALSAVGGFDLRRVARPHLERLCETLGETVHLVTLDRQSVLFVDSIETSQALRVGSRVGVAMPAHCTAGGKALLAQLPAEVLRARYPDQALERMTERSTTAWDALAAELEQVRHLGYATNYGESEEGIGAVAVPVGGPGERPMAITVSVPLSRLDRERVGAIADAALETAAAIAEQR